jgi:hypothetical protein
VVVVALVLWSAAGSLGRSFFMAVMMLPGVLFFKYFVGDLSFKNRWQGILDATYFTLALMLVEYLGIFFVYAHEGYPVTETPPAVVINPLFICLLLGALLSGEYLIGGLLRKGREPERDRFISFTSDRRRTTLELDTILYIESRDDEVTVITTGGEKYPTRMKISTWEAVLDDRFVRVHRSFIVGRLHITRREGHTLWLGDTPIELSRKYRERALDKIDSK